MAFRVVRWLVLSTVLVALCALSPRSTAAEAAAAKTVVTVYWSSAAFPGTQELDRVIRNALRSHSERVDYFAEFLESDRFPVEEASLALRDYIQRKYRQRRIDVVIAITDAGLEFVLRYRGDLFRDAPIVFSVVNRPDHSVTAAAPGATGLVSGDTIVETLALALTLHPATERAFYVLGPTVSTELRESIRDRLQRSAPHVPLTAITEPSLPRLMAAIRAVPANSIILYIRHSQEDPGSVLFPSEVASMVAHASAVPVYGISESYFGTNVVGGMVSSRQIIGTRLAQIVGQILAGTRPQDIPIESTPYVPMFDWRQLQRWRIPERSLPAETILLYRERSIWEQHRITILITAGVLLLQTLLIAGLVLEHRRRRRAEMDSRQHLSALAHLDRRAAMGELATSLAHELNQPLNAILQNVGVAQKLMTGQSASSFDELFVEIISDIRKDDLRAAEIIRRMRGLLRSHEFESLPVDLNEVAQETVAIVRPEARSRQIQLELQLTDRVRPILGDRVHLQQVLLNLVMNGMDAVATVAPDRRFVRVSTSQDDGEVKIAVADNGVGLPANRTAQIFEPFYTTKAGDSGMGMGLAIARSIVEAHGGRIAAENNSGLGATVWFSLPISADTSS